MNKILAALLASFMLGIPAVTLAYGHQRFEPSEPSITFKKEVSYSDVINIIIAVGISFYLPYAVGQAVEKRKSTKSLILYTCTELQCEIKRTINEIDSLATNEQAALFQRLAVVVQLSGIIVKHIDREYPSKLDTKALKVSLRKFRSALGDDVRKHGFAADESYMRTCFTAYRKYYSDIESLKFEINRI